MEKRASLGVLKKRPTKLSKRRGLLSYLRTNSYMFAPLIPRSGSHLFPQRTLLFSDTGELFCVHAMKLNSFLQSLSWLWTVISCHLSKGRRAREENGRRLAEKVGEYLKSDSYMYAPIVDTQESKATVAGTTGHPFMSSFNSYESLVVLLGVVCSIGC